MGNGAEQTMIGSIYRPEKKPFIQEAQTFLYNRDTGAILGRTVFSWAKILVFYIIFYICLAAFWSLLYMVVDLTLDPRTPKYKLKESLIGTNPGLGFRPMPNDSNSLSTLIWYKGTQEEDYEYWKESLEKFLQEYKKPGSTPGRGANIDSCSFEKTKQPGRVCEVNVRNFGPCTYENHFDYHKQSPCVFIKLNRIFDWVPEFYETPEDLPERMPQELKDHISNVYNERTVNGKKYSREQMRTVWVSCEGESPADIENIGNIEYYNDRGFEGYYFPFRNEEGYLSPLVAIHFQNPSRGILINIECKAWAKNIQHDRKDKLGMVHFEMLLD